VLLPLDVGQVEARLLHCCDRGGTEHFGFRFRGWYFSDEIADQLGKRGERDDFSAFNQGSLLGIGIGHDDGIKAFLVSQVNHRQDAVGMAQAAVQGQLAEKEGL
jgi:hypothetical protein